jgi:hypothetical protein
MNKHYERLVDAIDTLVINYEWKSQNDMDDGEIDFFDLDWDVQADLTRLMIEADGREVSECFLDPQQFMQDDDATCALLVMLKNPTQENRNNLTNVILNRSIKLHAKSLQTMIDESLRAQYAEFMEQLNKRLVRTGPAEYEWRKAS